jgi:hypothetical protein
MTASTMPRFEPMTVGILLDATVRLYAQHSALMLAITACAYLPFLAGVPDVRRAKSLKSANYSCVPARPD